jgi:hypothetical protein
MSNGYAPNSSKANADLAAGLVVRIGKRRRKAARSIGKQPDKTGCSDNAGRHSALRCALAPPKPAPQTAAARLCVAAAEATGSAACVAQAPAAAARTESTAAAGTWEADPATTATGIPRFGAANATSAAIERASMSAKNGPSVIDVAGVELKCLMLAPLTERSPE